MTRKSHIIHKTIKGGSKLEIFIPQFVRTALDRLNECGYEGYIVGGCVRDSLLGKKPHDYDVCTNCTPDKMLEVFANFRTIETGLKHGTLTVLIEGEPVEITCYRSDGEYIGHRKPAQVTFESSLEEDLKRRDFTVNAMAYSPKTGLIDLYGGQGDLEKGIIRCVGEPERRFDEDALRILRGLRFSSCLGFEIEEKTSKAILEQCELLKSISAERIASELKKLLCGKGARKILLDYREVIAVFIPELRESFDFRQNNPHHFLDVYGHICLSVENVRPQWQMRLTMLLHDIGKPRMHTVDENGISHFKKHQFQGAYMAEKILKRLRIDNASAKYIYELIWEHDNRIPATKKSVRRFMAQHDFDFVMDYLELDMSHIKDAGMTDYWGNLDGIDFYDVENEGEKAVLAMEINENNECIHICDLDINGKDLLQMGFGGKDIGIGLELALNGVIDEKVENKKEELKGYIESNFKRQDKDNT